MKMKRVLFIIPRVPEKGKFLPVWFITQLEDHPFTQEFCAGNRWNDEGELHWEVRIDADLNNLLDQNEVRALQYDALLVRVNPQKAAIGPNESVFIDDEGTYWIAHSLLTKDDTRKRPLDLVRQAC